MLTCQSLLIHCSHCESTLDNKHQIEWNSSKNRSNAIGANIESMQFEQKIPFHQQNPLRQFFSNTLYDLDSLSAVSTLANNRSLIHSKQNKKKTTHRSNDWWRLKCYILFSCDPCIFASIQTNNAQIFDKHAIWVQDHIGVIIVDW